MTLKRPRYRAAQKYDIPQQSISDRLKGQVALADQIQPRQLLIRSAHVWRLLKQLNNERTVGRNWVSKFINRHPDIKNKRGDEKEYGWIKPENTVNVDEGGIMSGFGLDSLVVGSADPKRKALLKGPQSRNWTSFIEAITADGRVLTPGIIFKGKELQKQWFLTEFGKIADWHYITRDQPMPQMLD
ncbi:DDE superfamily endonuclease [Hirsutella rhossiliensis]